MPTCAICKKQRKRKGLTCMECDTFFCLKCVEEFNLGDDEELDDCWECNREEHLNSAEDFFEFLSDMDKK